MGTERNFIKDNYLLVKDYKNDNALRSSFNELAKKTFGIDFEVWYQSGYWREQYLPYSIVDGNKIIANVSVNIMDFMCLGKRKQFIQLGTVMTDVSYRNQGLSRHLMELVLTEYKDKSDGIYLFANDNVLDFYPKFGFQKSTEYQFGKTVNNQTPASVIPISMSDHNNWCKIEEAIQTSAYNGAFVMHNLGLIMFYLTSFMSDNVYYISELDSYVIAEIKGNTLLLYSIFSKEIVDLDLVIQAFGKKVKQVLLEFTPINKDNYQRMEVHQPDTTLFIMGDDLCNSVDQEKMFPALSHA